MNADDMMLGATAQHPNAMVAWYILSSYAYYHLDRPILSDAAFDGLARRLLASWPDIVHPHKHLITEDALRAGTLLLSEDEYPGMAKGAAESILRAMAFSALQEKSSCGPSRIELFYRLFLQQETVK